MGNKVAEAVQAIRCRAACIEPCIGIILGSGLGSLVDDMSETVSIPYAEIPHFPVSGVIGHRGRWL